MWLECNEEKERHTIRAVPGFPEGGRDLNFTLRVMGNYGRVFKQGGSDFNSLGFLKKTLAVVINVTVSCSRCREKWVLSFFTNFFIIPPFNRCFLCAM